MDQSLIASIRETLKLKSTEGLRQAVQSGDKSVCSPEGFEALRQVLLERDTGKGPPGGSVSSRRPAARPKQDGIIVLFPLSVGMLVSLAGCAVSLVARASGLATFWWGDYRGGFYVAGGLIGFFYHAGMLIIFSRAGR
jgi:hypothetical protein